MSANQDPCDAGCGVPSDPELVAAGWNRRNLTSLDKAEELRRQYTELGFEVLERALTPDDFDSKCATCAEGAAHLMVVLYTRRAR